MTAALRYTALRVAALHPADRTWLLERLPVAEADALRTLATTPGIHRLARVAGNIDAPVPSTVSLPVQSVTAAQAYRVASFGIERLDPQWASLLQRATDHAGPALPAKLAAALTGWVPVDEADA